MAVPDIFKAAYRKDTFFVPIGLMMNDNTRTLQREIKKENSLCGAPLQGNFQPARPGRST